MALKKACSRRVLGKKRPNAFLVCLTDAALGDQAGYQLSRRHIEAVVRGRTFIRRNSDRDLLPITPTVGVFHFFRATLFDRNFLQSVAHFPIDRGRRAAQRKTERRWPSQPTLSDMCRSYLPHLLCT